MAKTGNLTFITRINPETEQYYPAGGKRRVFIAYKKSDNRLTGVRDIVTKKILRMYDVAVWHDANLTPGVNYLEEIKEAVRQCDALVLLLTHDILASSFVWDVEVAVATEAKKGIIPIAFDISQEDLLIIEKKLGENYQILQWPRKIDDTDIDVLEGFDDTFNQALEQAFDRYIIDSNLADKVEDFFDKKHILLTDEQKYMMGFGYLRGVGVEMDEEKGIRILSNILSIEKDDDSTVEIKLKSVKAIISYYYRIQESLKLIKDYVFISYSSKDKKTKNKIIKSLKEKGVSYWVAPDSIPGGSTYINVIENAIRNCSAVLLILSESSQESKWVPKELDIAISNDKTIVPFRIDSSELKSGLRLLIGNYQIIDATQDYESSIAKAIEDIKDYFISK